MTTVADRQVIRAYFNAGLLVVRPQYGVMRMWAESYRVLYQDSQLADMCRENEKWRIFLHQAALVAVVNLLERDKMIELPATYNYPVLFEKMFASDLQFDSLEDVVTLRHEGYFNDAESDWSLELKGPEHVISWLKERFGRE
jgi:hypothetical protein